MTLGPSAIAQSVETAKQGDPAPLSVASESGQARAPLVGDAMPPTMSGSPPRVGAPGPAPAPAGLSPLQQRQLEAKQKMEEMNRQRSEAEAKKAAYQEWLQKNELDSTGDAAYDGITVTDMGVSRTQAWVRTLDDGPDPPNGRSSREHDWRASLPNLRAVAAAL